MHMWYTVEESKKIMVRVLNMVEREGEGGKEGGGMREGGHSSSCDSGGGGGGRTLHAYSSPPFPFHLLRPL